MQEEIDFLFDATKDDMNRALSHMEKALVKIRAGRANPSMLEGVMVEYYGAPTPLNQVGNVSTTDPRTLTVQAYEKAMLDVIASAIINANLGLNPMNNGEVLIINVPPLTEERRRELSKRARSEGEGARVGIRNARKDANDYLKAAKDDGMSEDELKKGEQMVQELTDKYTTQVESVLSAKEADIMTI